MAPKPTTTDPIDPYGAQTAPRLSIAPAYVDPKTGALYIHHDLTMAPGMGPWANESHVSPIKATEKLGDIESWTAYIGRYAGSEAHAPLLTWSEAGLTGTLDYHTQEGDPGRCTWQVHHAFVKTVQWMRWSKIADGYAKSQGEVMEFFEDNAPDVKSPSGGEIANLIRGLRATVDINAETTLGEDGTTEVKYDKKTGVKTTDDLTIPPSVTIAIPLLKGHTALVDMVDEDGAAVLNDDGSPRQRLAPVNYELEVKVRVSVGGDHRPAFRLTIPRSEQAFEAVYADRVAAARALLGDLGQTLLRATS